MSISIKDYNSICYNVYLHFKDIIGDDAVTIHDFANQIREDETFEQYLTENSTGVNIFVMNEYCYRRYILKNLGRALPFSLPYYEADTDPKKMLIVTESGNESDDRCVIMLAMMFKYGLPTAGIPALPRERIIIKTDDDYTNPQHGNTRSIFVQTLLDSQILTPNQNPTKNEAYNLLREIAYIPGRHIIAPVKLDPYILQKRAQRFGLGGSTIKESLYEQKYLKYKQKYVDLKKRLNL